MFDQLFALAGSQLDCRVRHIFKLPHAATMGLAILTLCSLAPCAVAQHSDMAVMKRLVRMRFPSVSQLSTAELAKWLTDSKRQPPVLLDVRKEEEYAVSHLPGAIRVEPGASPEAVRSRIPPNRPVVTYCSVGYRSSALAQQLGKAGVNAVYNLEGSIFQWANEGRPVEAEGRRVERVHPYNRTFGKLLDQKRRAKL